MNARIANKLNEVITALHGGYGVFLRVALGVFLALYFTYLKARWEQD
ncbi:MAG: hypothetical protein WCK27_07855 [Verrucomicrobiota bacterium]